MNTKSRVKPKQRAGKNNFVLSGDGKWKSFPEIPNLRQYVPSGNYFGRVKVDGRLVRRSLETDVWTTALLRLQDFRKKNQQSDEEAVVPTFAESQELFEEKLARNRLMKPSSKKYRRLCINKIAATWPSVAKKPINEISEKECQAWADKLSEEVASQYFNNIIGTFRKIIDEGIKQYLLDGGSPLPNPGKEIDKAKIEPKDLQLPEPEQFDALVRNIREKSGSWGRPIADAIEFLAYTGMRAFSEAQHCQWDDIDWKRNVIIVRGAPETGTKNGKKRRIPIIENLKRLLESLKERIGEEPTGQILEVGQFYTTLDRACRDVGIPRMRIHDLRHLFATRCIESGVDIPTVSRWLGHKDGGALAMRVYGHLRDKHSQSMAEKVSFSGASQSSEMESNKKRKPEQ